MMLGSGWKGTPSPSSRTGLLLVFMRRCQVYIVVVYIFCSSKYGGGV
jgi:hypothetical protein